MLADRIHKTRKLAGMLRRLVASPRYMHMLSSPRIPHELKTWGFSQLNVSAGASPARRVPSRTYPGRSYMAMRSSRNGTRGIGLATKSWPSCPSDTQ